MTAYKLVTATEIKKVADDGGLIVDVRTPLEHQTQHLLRPHDHVPIDQIEPEDFMLRRGLDRDTPLYFLCRSGGRARTAAEKFSTAGFKNVHVIEGGIVACESSGEPVSGGVTASVTNTKVISLERQVRIAAGTLVATGTFTGYTLHPFFYLLPFMVGLGLVYAGATDRCGMALVLTQMPWNKNIGGASCGMKPPANTPSAGGCS